MPDAFDIIAQQDKSLGVIDPSEAPIIPTKDAFDIIAEQDNQKLKKVGAFEQVKAQMDNEQVRKVADALKTHPWDFADKLTRNELDLFGAKKVIKRGLNLTEPVSGIEETVPPEILQKALDVASSEIGYKNPIKYLGLLAKIPSTIGEFALLPEVKIFEVPAGVSKVAKVVSAAAKTGTKFAEQTAFQLPNVWDSEKTWTDYLIDKGVDTTKAFAMGSVVSGINSIPLMKMMSEDFKVKFPKTSVAVDKVAKAGFATGAFVGETAATGGNAKAMIDTAITIIGFEAFGAMRDGKFKEAVQYAKKYNEELKQFDDATLENNLRDQFTIDSLAKERGRDIYGKFIKGEELLKQEIGKIVEENKLVPEKTLYEKAMESGEQQDDTELPRAAALETGGRKELPLRGSIESIIASQKNPSPEMKKLLDEFKSRGLLEPEVSKSGKPVVQEIISKFISAHNRLASLATDVKVVSASQLRKQGFESGYFSPIDKKVYISEDLNPREVVNVLSQELMHAYDLKKGTYQKKLNTDIARWKSSKSKLTFSQWMLTLPLEQWKGLASELLQNRVGDAAVRRFDKGYYDEFESTTQTPRNIETIKTVRVVKAFKTRVLEGLDKYRNEINPEWKETLSKAFSGIQSYVKNQYNQGRKDVENFMPEAKNIFLKGISKDKLKFEPLWDKIDTKKLFNEVNKISDMGDRLTTDKALRQVLDGYAPTESEALSLGEVFGFDFMQALGGRIKVEQAMKTLFKLGEGQSLTVREAHLLSEFSPKLKDKAWKAVPLYRKGSFELAQLWNGVFAIKFGGDVSNWMRQAKTEFVRHPSKGIEDFLKSMTVYWGSLKGDYQGTKEGEAKFTKFVQEVKNDPYYEEMKIGGMRLYDILPGDKTPISELPEFFIGRKYAEKVPLLGNLVKAGERSWSVGMSLFRTHLYGIYRPNFTNVNGDISPANSIKLCRYINSMTGEPTLYKGQFTDTLRALALAPKFTTSRVLNPLLAPGHLARAGYIKMTMENKAEVAYQDALQSGAKIEDAQVLKKRILGTELEKFQADMQLSKMAAESFASLIAANVVTGLFLSATGMLIGQKFEDTIELNPYSKSFGKIRLGNTRIDLWAGYSQPVRALIQAMAGKTITASGRLRDTDRKDIIATLMRTKIGLFTGLVVDVIQGHNFLGEPFLSPPESSSIPGYSKLPKAIQGIGKEGYDRFMTMFISDFIDAWRESGFIAGLFGGGLSFIGEGVSSYKDSEITQLQKYQDGMALDKYGKMWEDLTIKEQEKLSNRNPILLQMENAVKLSRLTPVDRSNLEQEQWNTGIRVFASLPDNIQDSLKTVGIKKIELSRKIGDFIMNDKRFDFYEQEVIKNLNSPQSIIMLSRLQSINNLKIREDRANEILGDVRERARNILTKKLNRNEI